MYMCCINHGSKLPQNSYDARYLVERLDVGSGAALAHSFVKNPLRKAKSSIAVIAHKLDDKVPEPAMISIVYLHQPHSQRYSQSFPWTLWTRRQLLRRVSCICADVNLK